VSSAFFRGGGKEKRGKRGDACRAPKLKRPILHSNHPLALSALREEGRRGKERKKEKRKRPNESLFVMADHSTARASSASEKRRGREGKR